MNRRLSTMAVVLALCGGALAQYTGGMATPGMPSPGSPTYTNKSYGVNKAAVGALVGGGAGAAVLYMTRLRHPRMQGCVGPDGRTLVKDNGKSYTIVGNALQPGERVVVSSKKMKDDSGAAGIGVLQVRKDLGQCQQEARSSPPAPSR